MKKKEEKINIQMENVKEDKKEIFRIEINEEQENKEQNFIKSSEQVIS